MDLMREHLQVQINSCILDPYFTHQYVILDVLIALPVAYSAIKLLK